MTFRTVLLHGLKVRSDLPLGGPSISDDEVDLTIETGERRTIASGPLEGERIAELAFPGFGYSVAVSADGVLVRFDGLCEAIIDFSLRSVHVDLDPSCSPEFGALLAGGNLVAIVLRLMGEPFIHASAVALGDCAVALTGQSGAGKSTLAAMLCATGMSLVSDDLLRLRMDVDVRCVPGPPVIRLRPSARELAGAFGDEAATPDGRTSVTTLFDTHEPSLRCVVFLRLDDRPEINALSQAAVVGRLLDAPRLPGWKRSDFMRQEFEMTTKLARCVPGYELSLPAGPPFDVLEARALIDGVIA